MDTKILHICTQTDWRAALENGAFTAASLESEGFIHCSTAEQVVKVANAFYSTVPDLVLLHIIVERIPVEVKWEDADGDTFPHIYGPINLEAVEQVEAFAPGPDRLFVYPPIK